MRIIPLIAMLLFGCAPRPPASKPQHADPDPTSRALHEIPFAPPRPGPFVDEEQAFAAARAVYRSHGFDEPVSLELAESVILPYASGGAAHTWRFLGDGPAARAHVDTISRRYYGGRLAAWEGRFPSPEAATAALHAFMIAALGHEIAHVLSASRGINRYADDPWLEETRAIRFEWAVLRELVARGAVPAEVIADNVAFNRMLLSGAPPGLVDSLPKDAESRRARFNAGYHFLAEGETQGHEADVDAVLALYTIVRLEVAAAPPEPFEVLIPLLAPPPPDPTPMATAARAILRRGDLPLDGVDDTGLTAWLEGSNRTATLGLAPFEATPQLSGGIVLAARVRLEAPLPQVKRPALAVLLGRANREHDRVVCDVASDEPVVGCRTVVMGEPETIDQPLLLAVARVLRFWLRWQEAMNAVLINDADPATVAPAETPEIP
jgi:hypothetical protein